MPELASIAATNAWLHPLAPTTPPSLSERVIRALEAHASAEAEHTSDQVLKLLVGLIADDERRHHSLLQSMVRRLQQEVEFVESATALPVESADSADDPELVNTLRSLIRDEHEGARHLRHLARQDPHLYNGLYPVLLETIARDSEKHATMFRYLLLRIEDRVG